MGKTEIRGNETSKKKKNHVAIDLVDVKAVDNKAEYAELFCEGDPSLAKLLLKLWENGIDTRACCTHEKYVMLQFPFNDFRGQKIGGLMDVAKRRGTIINFAKNFNQRDFVTNEDYPDGMRKFMTIAIKDKNNSSDFFDYVGETLLNGTDLVDTIKQNEVAGMVYDAIFVKNDVNYPFKKELKPYILKFDFELNNGKVYAYNGYNGNKDEIMLDYTPTDVDDIKEYFQDYANWVVGKHMEYLEKVAKKNKKKEVEIDRN